ncbi:MAG: hypothetical protein ACJ8FS_01530 [Sphingomicrobium sp.]
MTVADTHDDVADAWADFLAHANKVYAKLRAACHGQPLDWMWWKKKMDERRDDPLLAYIHHARNCDTHRLEDTTREMRSDIQRPILLPVAVIDKGILYPPPTEHRGQRSAGDVAFTAWLAGTYLQELVAEAESRLR